MKRLTDTLVTLLISALIVGLIFSMIRPYAVWLLVGGAALLVGRQVYQKSHNW
jgi:hypothetical protein